MRNHTAVRRLHLAGGSLREIAEALALSHQRVQQIVNVTGGSWWQRIWRRRNVKRDAVCTFCDRPPSEVAKLVAGPDVYICDACVALAEEASAGRARAPAGRVALARPGRGSGAPSVASGAPGRGSSRPDRGRASAANACASAARSWTVGRRDVRHGNAAPGRTGRRGR